MKLAAPNSYELTLQNKNYIAFKAHIIYPADYFTAGNTKKYPLLLFGHGAGEAGSSTSVIYNSGSGGPAYFNTKGKWGAVTNPADGASYEFIVLTPQAGSWSPSAAIMAECLDWMLSDFRVDISRIYWMGLSAAGTAMMGYNIDYPNNPAIAAYVVMAGVCGGYNKKAGEKIAKDNTRWWGLYDLADDNGVQTQNWKRAIDDNKAGLTKETLHKEGHGGWQRFDPSWRLDGKSFYEWALQYKTGDAPTPDPTPDPVPDPVPDTELAKVVATLTLPGVGTLTAYSDKTTKWN